jgi:hypothetical protein
VSSNSHVSPPPSLLYRSIHRGRVIFAQPGWVLEESPARVVTATLPGTEVLMLVGGRHELLEDIANGCERTEIVPWYRSRVVWVTPFGEPFAIGLFWADPGGQFLCHYINLQDPVRRTALGLDSRDHVLDIVVKPDGSWRWKDQDELETAVRCGMFSAAEAATFRRNGEAVVARLPDLLPTGWENWQPDPMWPTLRMPAGWNQVHQESVA